LRQQPRGGMMLNEKEHSSDGRMLRNERVTSNIPLVKALAGRLAASMSRSIDVDDLIQDGMIGLIHAASRFEGSRGIKFETFAERRVRGAMIDALRRKAWPRGIRRVRRELDAAREKLRVMLGHEPSLTDLARHMGANEARLHRTIVRIKTIEVTSPLVTSETVDWDNLPPVFRPSEPLAPDEVYEHRELAMRIREAIVTLPWQERKVIRLYYYGGLMTKEIGKTLKVDKSQVSRIRRAAVHRLRRALGSASQSGNNSNGSTIPTKQRRRTLKAWAWKQRNPGATNLAHEARRLLPFAKSAGFRTATELSIYFALYRERRKQEGALDY
jgi:RNA polymerase sigma factor FliA